MKQRVAAFAGAMALGLVVSGAANAQGSYYGYGPRYYEQGLLPSQIITIVRYAGFTPLSAPARRGSNYVVIAAGRGGGHVRIVVNAHDGEIVGVRPLVALRPYGGPAPYDPRIGGAVPPRGYDEPPPPYGPPGAAGRDGYGPGAGSGPHVPRVGRQGPGAGIDRGPQPLPPRDIPNPGLANAPATTGTATVAPPARTPIPRPRPSLASNEAPTAPAATAATPAPAQAPAAGTPPTAAGSADVPEAPPAPLRTRPATPMVPVAPLD